MKRVPQWEGLAEHPFIRELNNNKPNKLALKVNNNLKLSASAANKKELSSLLPNLCKDTTAAEPSGAFFIKIKKPKKLGG